jgi:hypothetical protein
LRLNGNTFARVFTTSVTAGVTTITVSLGTVPSPLNTVEVSSVPIEALPPTVVTYDNISGATGVVQKTGSGLIASGDFYTRSDADSTFLKQTDANTNFAPLASPNFTGTPKTSGNTMWHSGNDGNGSGLDADTVRGQVVFPASALPGGASDAINYVKFGPGFTLYFGLSYCAGNAWHDIPISPAPSVGIAAFAAYINSASVYPTSSKWTNTSTVSIYNGHNAETIQWMALGLG